MWRGPRHFAAARIVTMRGRSNRRRPADDDEGRRARGRGGRLPGDESLPCPPVAAAHSRLVAGAPLIAGLLAGPAAPRQAGGRQGPDRSAHRRCVPGHADASAPVKGDTLTVSGTLTNKGTRRSPTRRSICVSGRGSPAGARSTTAAERTGYLPGRDPAKVGGKYTVKVAELAAGVSRDFTLSVPVEQARTSAKTACTSSGSPSRAGPPMRLRPGARHPADLPALAAGGRREQDPAHLPLAADRIGTCHRGDRLRRPADPGVRR